MSRTFTKGIVDENPLCVYLLGLCPALAVSVRVIDAVVMGFVLCVVSVITSTASSGLKAHIPERFRIFICTAIAGSCASVVEILLKITLPGVADNLGIFVPLITVNSLIMDRALDFARENTPGVSFWDALGMGTGFFLAFIGIGIFREALGSGTITLVAVGDFSGVITIPGIAQSPIRVLGLSAGGFLVLGYLKAAFDLVRPPAPQTRTKNPHGEEKQ